MDAWSQIANWPVDATSDDIGRYFFITPQAGSILNGERCLVVGGKGAGKTALSRYLETRSSKNTPCLRLGSSEYKFATLFSRAGTGAAARACYVEMWRYFILKQALHAAANGAGSAHPSTLAKADHLSSTVLEYLRKFKFARDLLGSYDEMPPPATEEARAAINSLDRLVRKKAAGRPIFIIFDELDDGYKGQLEYLECFRGLIDACEVFARDKHGPVKPIVFLRDDIYNALPGGRMGKWTDIKIDLKWNLETIQRLLAFRISRSFDENTEQKEPAFSVEWERLFSAGKITEGSRLVGKFDYIAERTLNRPRDYICFVKECASLKRNDEDGLEQVDADLLRKAECAYSDFLWVELIDQMESHCSRSAFTAIEKIAPDFRVDSFRAAFQAATGNEVSLEEALCQLRALSRHGVIRDLDESPSGSFAIHKGLCCRLKLSDDGCGPEAQEVAGENSDRPQ